MDYDGVESSILKTVKTKKTELLFLGLMLRMMKTGGRAAVIVPARCSVWLFECAQVDPTRIGGKAKVGCCYFHAKWGVQTLCWSQYGHSHFPRKQILGGTDNVWFYDMANDSGFSLDDKRSEIKDNDIPDIVERWGKLKAVKKNAPEPTKASLFPFEEIKTNDWDLSINRYKEVEYEVGGV